MPKAVELLHLSEPHENVQRLYEACHSVLAADPTVTFRLIGENGNVRYEITLTRSQLTPRGT